MNGVDGNGQWWRPGLVPVPPPGPGMTGACTAVESVMDALVPDEALLRVLEAAVGQLHQVVAELRQVGQGTRQLSGSVHGLSRIDWRSPAGEAFVDRTQVLRGRADELAGEADEAAALAGVAIEDLQQRITELRGEIQAAKAIVLRVATAGVC